MGAVAIGRMRTGDFFVPNTATAGTTPCMAMYAHVTALHATTLTSFDRTVGRSRYTPRIGHRRETTSEMERSNGTAATARP
jgi:hypothetical protein